MGRDKTEISTAGIVTDVFMFRGSSEHIGVLTVLDSEKKKLKVVGVVEGIRVGDNVEVTGYEQEHPHYGLQIRAQKIDTTLPRSRHVMSEWLTRHFGIGFLQAKDIVADWYEDVSKIAPAQKSAFITPGDFELSRLWGAIIDNVPMIRELFDKHRADGAYTEVRQYVVRKHVTDALVRMGLDTKEAFALYMIRGERAADELRNDPYVVYYYLEGVLFRKIDEIYLAQKGNKKNDDRRIRATCLFELRSCTDEGHTAMYYDDFLALLEELHPEFSGTKLLTNIQELIPDFMMLYGNPPMIQLSAYARYEAGIAEFVTRGKVLTVPPEMEREESDDGAGQGF